ncbi:MAG: protein disulfide oxidoreductase [Thioalkalispiraceae bacterium]|jgi:peroxiredoxin
MNPKLRTFLKIPGIKLVIEIILIIAVYFAVKAYVQRDLVTTLPASIEARSMDGETVNLSSLKGKPVLLYFWGSWCPICKLQQDNIKAISRDYTVIGVAIESGTDQELAAYLQEHDLKFINIPDPQSAIAEKFGVGGVPVSFIINPEGEVSFVEKGYTSEYGLRIRLWLSSL